jgi:hypothetical protein
MAKLYGITLPAGWELIYNKTLRRYDISVMCNVGKNSVWKPRKVFVQLKEITYLYAMAYSWGNYTTLQKTAWKNAANIIGSTGYNLFCQDTIYRRQHSIAGIATPSIYHQYLVGHVKIESPANSAKLIQPHNTKIYFPCTFETSFKSNLTASGANPYARFNFKWMRYTAGQNIEEIQTIEIPLIQDWNNQLINITTQTGLKGKWIIELELNDVVGDLWFDNIFVEYNATIKNNDPFCMDVVKWYQGENMPAGVTLETVYPPD